MAAIRGDRPASFSESRLVPMRRELDVYLAIAQARQLASALGFDAYASTEIQTAVSELARNVLRRGVEGETWLRRLGDRFEVTCTDRGPGFAATAGSPPAGLGIGLPGVGRLMDGVAAADLPFGGAQVTAWRWLRPASRRRASGAPGDLGAALSPLTPFPAPLQGAVALRPIKDESTCGDAYAILPLAHGLLLAVIDGVGHGQGAAEAAQQVVDALGEVAATRPNATLPEFLHAAHLAAQSGRGAVATLFRTGPAGAAWAGVGNVRIYRLGPPGVSEASSAARGHPGGFRVGAPGCLGVRWSDPPALEEPVASDSLVVLATDGVPDDAVEVALGRLAGHWARPAPSKHPGIFLRELAESILAQSDGHDDALVLVARVS